MWRCLQLAQLGAGSVAPNPMVGAVLVHNNRIIGEGYHQQYGQPHAEVNCINSVLEGDKKYIGQSTIYVSLEPCAHFGKTPPCADLIIKHKIPKVVVGCKDPFDKVNGSGIDKLKSAGVEVVENVLNKDCIELNKRFFTFHQKQRPYIILKWAQSSNLKIAEKDFKAVKISNDLTNKLVHKWRSEEAAIAVGYNTALYDNPSLTTRLWTGNDGVRVVLDKNLQLPQTLHLFDQSVTTFVINAIKDEQDERIFYCRAKDDEPLIQSLLKVLYERQLNSVIIEGGAKLLQAFIDANLWDEARVITNKNMIIEDGIGAPKFNGFNVINVENILTDEIKTFRNNLAAQ